MWSGTLEASQIAVLSLDTGERKTLTQGTYPRYVPSGHIVFAREASLWAVPFDVERLELTGTAVPMVDGVWVSPESGSAQFAIASNGTLVYARGDAYDNARTLVWVDRAGNEEPLEAEPRRYLDARLSPDGTRIALRLTEQASSSIWIWELARATLTRFTFDGAIDWSPIWTPDGTRIAFASDRGGLPDIYWKAADGTGAVEKLGESENARVPQSFSPDGKQLVYRETARRYDLGTLTVGGSAEPLLANDVSELNADISPDGRFIAYESDASGEEEIYVRPFPNVDEGRWQISIDGGVQPVWSPDGRELFYLTAATTLASTVGLMAVPTETSPSFAHGNPSVVFEGSYANRFVTRDRTYDIAPDGERFLMVKLLGAGQDSTTELIIVQNWFQELERLAPTQD